MKDNELQALASLLDEDDKEILTLVEQQIYKLGFQMLPFLEQEKQKQANIKTQRRIATIVRNIQFETALQRLQTWKETQQDDLLQALWIIANYQYIEVSLQDLRDSINNFYEEVIQVLKEGWHPYDQVKAINTIIFGKLRFKPNPDFQSIDNSMINKVLELRVGNPITLCCVYILITEKFKLPIYGVNLPNIFILTYKDHLHQFYINPTNKGVIFSKADIENYIEQLAIQMQPTYYEPCQPIDIVKRILRNLIYAYEKQNKHQHAVEMKQLLEVL
jgi:regulator of sirC expression with transglutaminase-like and TPR domain